MFCQQELRGLGAISTELASLGVDLVAISVDPPARNREVVARQRLPFTILSDEDRRVTREYGLLHAGGGPGGSDIAIPANVLVDAEGVILWRHTAAAPQDRLSNAELLAAVRAHLPGDAAATTDGS